MKTKFITQKYFKFIFLNTLMCCIILLTLGVITKISMAIEKHPNISHYDIIKQRNIFKPNSVASKIETEKNSSSPTVNKESSRLDNYILTGIISIRGTYKAIIRNTVDHRGFYVSTNDTIEDYTVNDIQKNFVHLEKDGEIFQLKIQATTETATTKFSPKKNGTIVQETIMTTDSKTPNNKYKSEIIQSIRQGIPHVKR